MLIQVRFHIKSSVTHFAVQSVDAGVNRLVMSQSFFCTVSFSTVITVEAPSVMFHHVFRPCICYSLGTLSYKWHSSAERHLNGQLAYVPLHNWYSWMFCHTWDILPRFHPFVDTQLSYTVLVSVWQCEIPTKYRNACLYKWDQIDHTIWNDNQLCDKHAVMERTN